MHTLFFDEEYVEDGVFSDSHLLFPSGKGEELWNADHPHASKAEQGEAENSSKDDSTVVYLSDNEQQPTMSMISMVSKNQCDNRLNSEQELSTSLFQTPAPLACMINHRGERTQSNLSPTQSCIPDFTKEIQCFPGSAKENFPERQGHEDRLGVDDMSDEDESDLPFCPDSNLFNSHFGNLSTAIKVWYLTFCRYCEDYYESQCAADESLEQDVGIFYGSNAYIYVHMMELGCVQLDFLSKI